MLVDIYEPALEGLDFPPPERLLDALDQDLYTKWIAKSACAAASSTLSTAFWNTNHHVQELYGLQATISAWQAIVLPRHYRDLHYCGALEFLAEIEPAVASGEIADLPYSQHVNPAIKVDNPVRKRWLQLMALVNLALEDHAPAQLELARRSEAERGIRLTPEFAWFILSRATANGHEDPDLARLRETAQAALGAEARAALGPIIETGDWPRERAIVRD